MKKPEHAVIVVGSPKGIGSTSNSLGTYLAEELKSRDVAVVKVYIKQSLSSKENRDAMLRFIDESDLIVLFFPLYVDCLHSDVIQTLEIVAEHVKGNSKLDSKCFAAIVNSGFPEAAHSDVALRVCRNFSERVGFAWAGGLAMGGGPMISGRPLSEVGGAVRNQVKALKLAADALADGKPIPVEAEALMANIGIPRFLYLWIGNRGWRQKAKHNSVENRLYEKPYWNVRVQP